jgi:hypothetical protein
MARVKGIAVLSCLRFVRERHGEEGLERLRAAITPEHRSMLDARVLPHAWTPFELIVDLNVQADALFGVGDLQLCVEMGRYAASASLPTVFKVFFRLGSPRFLFDTASKLWSAQFDSGRLTVSSDSDTSARLRIEDFEAPHRSHCLAVKGWALEAITLSGARPVRAEETHCRTWGHPYCEFSAAWADD